MRIIYIIQIIANSLIFLKAVFRLFQQALNKLRIVVIDGTSLDIPHSDEKSRVFGRERRSSRYKSRISLPLY